MKINLDAVIHDQDFKPILEGVPPSEGAEAKRSDVTLRSVIRRALTADADASKDKQLSEDVKFSRFKLAMKVDGARIGEEFNVAEAAMILEVAKLAYGTLIYGQIRMALEAAGGGEEKADKKRPNGKAEKDGATGDGAPA